MNKEEPYRDQAERLRQKIEKINEPNEQDSAYLPPRSDVHRNRKKKTKLKLKYPLIRLLVLFFILLPITIFAIYSYKGGHFFEAKKASVSSSTGYETVSYENSTKSSEKPKQKLKSGQIDKNTSNNSAQEPSKKDNQESGDSPAVQSSAAEKKPADIQASASMDKTNASDNQTAAISKQDNDVKIIYHRVKLKETLYSIARAYYQSNAGVNIIKQANNLQSDSITEGQILKIPLNY